MANGFRRYGEKRQTPKAAEAPKDPDVIQIPVEDISQANQQIIEDAINRTLALDWSHFGLTDLVELRKILSATSTLTLRQTEMNFQLNMLNAGNEREGYLLESIAPEYKSQIADQYWLVMLSGSIDPEEATFIRDWLWMKGPEGIASIKHLPTKGVLDHLIKSDKSFERAIFRAARYMQKRGKAPF